ncbi:MAG: cytochrome c oxidase subunit 3 [Gammaproteobacteria bacterium]
MTATLVFLAVLLAVFVGWLLRQSINVQPWVAHSETAARASHLPEGFTAARVGLAVFVAVATSLFALTISAYVMRMHMAADWRHLHAPQLLWVNTVMLLFGSIALQWAWGGAKRGDPSALRFGLATGGACSIAFVVGQYFVWRGLNAAGYYAAANPANAFFFMMTGLHALHLLGGLVAWGRTVRKVWRGSLPARVRGSVELCALYWHYLFIVWIVLFGLVLMH